MQHETAFYPEQYQGDISKLNYITNLLYDCMKLNQDFKEKIKPVTLYQLSGDYAELKKELKQKETDEYDYRRHIPYVKVDGKLRDEEAVKRSMMPRFASILDKAITRKPKLGETLPEACQHNEWEISSLGLDFKTLSYQNFIEAMKLKNPTDRQIRNALISYVIQFLINGGLIKDSHELRVFERIMHKYTYLASALYFHGLFEIAIPIIKESIVVMNAISNIDLEVAMNTKNEVTYQITIKILSNLFRKNLITKDEFNKFKHKMLEKYNPKLSELMELSLDK